MKNFADYYSFDFNDPSYPSGSYRLGLSPANSPGDGLGDGLGYGNVLVVRNNSSDTLAMLAFPFTNTGRFYYRQGNEVQWPTAPWYYFQGTIVE